MSSDEIIKRYTSFIIKMFKDKGLELSDVEKNELGKLCDDLVSMYGGTNAMDNIREQLKDINVKDYKTTEELIEKIHDVFKNISEEDRKQIAYAKIKNDVINKEMTILEIEAKIRGGINGGLIETLRHRQKEDQYFESQVKKLREGLTLTEELNNLYIKVGESLGFNTDKIRNGIKEIKKGVQDIVEGGKKFADPWAKVDQSAADFQKRLGGTASALRNLRQQTIDVELARHIGSRYNVSMEELIKMQSDYALNSGRKIDLTYGQRTDMAAIHAAAGENGDVIAQNLENYGIDMTKSGAILTEMFNSATKKGIAFEAVSKNLRENIKMAQSYTFADGVRGVERMAERSAALKLNMQQTSAFAEKVSSLEGAMQAGAGLSVLGGAFARNSNPLAMLYEGLNDAEALQERTIRMIEGLGHFDKVKGQIDMSAFNRMRVRAMAQQTGMDYANLMESANAMARRKEVEAQIRGMYGGDEELAELVKNTAQLDGNGKAYVAINGEKKDVKDITAADKSQLRINSNSQEENIRDIAQNLRGMKDLYEGKSKQLESIYAKQFELIGEAYKDFTKAFNDSNVMLAITNVIPDYLKVIQGLVASINGILILGNARSAFKTAKGFLTPIISKGGSAWTANPLSSPGGYWKGVGSRAVGGGVATLAGGAVMGATRYIYNNRRKDNGYVAGNTIGGMMTGAGIGGTFLGPWGALGGAIVGGAVGFGTSLHAKAKDDIKAEIENATGHWLNGDYDKNELEAILHHRVSGTLRQKMQSNGDLLPGYRYGGMVRKRYVNGTNQVVGKGTSTSDSVPAMLSVGEAVVSADNVKGNGMTISAINNGEKVDKRLMNIKKVAPNSTAPSVPSHISIDPLNINISGTIKLDLGNQKMEVDVNQLLRNQQFVNEISKLINAQLSYGFRKEETKIKYSFPHK